MGAFHPVVEAEVPRCRVKLDPEGFAYAPARLGRLEDRGAEVGGTRRVWAFTDSRRQIAKLRRGQMLHSPVSARLRRVAGGNAADPEQALVRSPPRPMPDPRRHRHVAVWAFLATLLWAAAVLLALQIYPRALARPLDGCLVLCERP